MTPSSPGPASTDLASRWLTPLNRRRIANFRANRRGLWSLRILSFLLLFALLAEVIANDRPVVLSFNDEIFFPVLFDYAETAFGGDFATTADYRDPYLESLIEESGWMVWPVVRFSYDTINFNLQVPVPSPPSSENWLGTDDQARDVFARVLYGFRLSLVFGLTLTLVASVVGVMAGAVQGYFGGWLDLIFQRVIEIWNGLPQLFVLIIVSSFVAPGFWTLLIVLLLFSWTALVAVVRAEFLRARNFDYVRAAKALGMGDGKIMVKHVLPNAMVATITFLPFILSGSVVALTSLDFLGLGLPPGSPSLGEMLRQGKEHLQAPWLGLTAFFTLAGMLTLLVFIGEAVRDAFDPRRDTS
jgi:microcin C transport system permease protein